MLRFAFFFLFLCFFVLYSLSCSRGSSAFPPKEALPPNLPLAPVSAVAKQDLAPALPENKPVEFARLELAIHGSAFYLTQHCNAEGFFQYRLNVDRSLEPEDPYNILRHAGTIYALAEYSKRYPNTKLPALQTIDNAIHFMKKKCIAPLPERPDLKAVWSLPEFERTPHPLVKLGGVGLGLVALISYESLNPGTTPLHELQELAHFICFMQKEDGSFYSKYDPKYANKRNDRWTSLYYPGEAALGLILLYEKDPAPLWIESATRVLGYLATLRQNESTVDPDHWALLATARLLPFYQKLKLPVPEKKIRDHALQICWSILSEQPRFEAQSPFIGCLFPDGQTCPTATRLEGLLAALTFLPPSEKALIETILNQAHSSIAFLISAQISEGAFKGGIPRALKPLPKGHPYYSLDFNKRAGEIRIDYVQHALSAFLQYQALVFP